MDRSLPLAPNIIEPPTSKAEATRARINRTAISLFAAKGVDQVTTRELAQAAGLSEGALYRHFSGKDEFARELFFSIHEQLADAIGKSTDGALALEDQIDNIVAAYCDTADRDWEAFTFHLLNTHRFLPYAENYYAAHPGGTPKSPVGIVEDIVIRAMDKGDIESGPKESAALKAAMALGIVLQAAFHKIYGRIHGPLGEHKETFSNAIYSVLKS